MKRHWARLLAPACCAAALPVWGCGDGGGAAARAQHPDGFTVGLELRGESGERRMLACSSVHNYAQFRAGREIKYDGKVRPKPDGRWNVKVKIKRCVDGRFQDSGADRVPGVDGGQFEGVINPPGKGVFFARARYRDSAGDVVSDKAFFEVR
jgi:hypothetical protein